MVKGPGGDGRSKRYLETIASTVLAPGQLVECGRGPVGAGVDATSAHIVACQIGLTVRRRQKVVYPTGM